MTNSLASPRRDDLIVLATLSDEGISGTPNPLGRGGYTLPTLKKEEQDGAKMDYNKKIRCSVGAVWIFGSLECTCGLWCNSTYKKDGMVMSRNDLLVIGSDVRYCPHCEEVLSFRDGKDFCRKCDKEIHEIAIRMNNENSPFCRLALPG